MLSPLWIIIQGSLKITSCMRPASQMSHLFFLSIMIIHRIAVCLKIAFKTFKHMHRCLLPTSRLVVKDYISINGALIHPIVSQMSFAFFSLVQHLYCRFVYLEVAV